MHLHLHHAIRETSTELPLGQVILRVVNLPSTDSSLAAELWIERYLNQLHLRLNAALSALDALNASSNAEESTPHALSLEDRILQVFVQELSRALDGEVVAIAKPTVDRDQFVVHHMAGSVLTLSPARCFTKQTALECNSHLTQSELESFQQAKWQSAWQLIDRSVALKPPSDRMAWLVTASSPMSAELVATEALFLEMRSYLVSQAIAQTIPILRQAQRLQELTQRCEALKAQHQDLIQTSKLKSEFLANTSHEIRTPLSSILGFTHLLREQGYDAANPRHQDYLKIILSSGQHLLALINDILDLSKIEANQLDLHKEVVDVTPVCQIALKLVQEKASDKGLALKLEIAPTVRTVIADPLRLKQMLFNLLSNALKFTNHGSVGLQVQPVEGNLHFTVWDTGTGISEEQQRLLFRPYTQLMNANRGEGTGLGLALTQKLAELHGGWVQVNSVLAQGSQFTIALPLPPPQDAQTSDKELSDKELDVKLPAGVSPASQFPASLTSSTIKHSSCQRPCSILLVEDNLHNARLMITFLCKLGYQVIWAQDSREMWQFLGQSLPALILMDIHLPGVDGLSLTRELQAQTRYCSIPVIAQTAMAMKGDRERCLAAGASDYISKPIDLAALAQLVAKYCHRGEE
jgi:hypothetical protein